MVTFLFALAVAYFAIQNAYGVPLVVANNIFPSVPLYAIIIGSVLVGILLASLISSMDSLSAYMRLRGKEQTIQEDQKAIHDLQEKVQHLEIENAQLKNESQHTVLVEEPQERTERPLHRPSFFDNLFHPRT